MMHDRRRLARSQEIDNLNTGYLWGYNNSYPVAKVVNASVVDIAATSFESDGKGNWTFSGPVYNDIAVEKWNTRL